VLLLLVVVLYAALYCCSAAAASRNPASRLRQVLFEKQMTKQSSENGNLYHAPLTLSFANGPAIHLVLSLDTLHLSPSRREF